MRGNKRRDIKETIFTKISGAKIGDRLVEDLKIVQMIIASSFQSHEDIEIPDAQIFNGIWG